MFTLKKIVAMVVIGILSLVSPIAIFNLWENLDAHEIMVVQSPVEGLLTVYTEPGVKWQGFGAVTKYPRRAQYDFCSVIEVVDKEEKIFRCPGARADAKQLRFNDGGEGKLSGAVSWEMPLDPSSVIEIHKKFGNAQGVDQQAVAKMIDSAVYLAGPLMSSTESSGERRAELVQYINDQAENGVYVTKATQVVTKDPVTGAEKHVLGTVIVRDDKGMPRRQQGSILAEFNIKLLPISITELKYDDVVESQIKQRQEATTQVQIAQANARRAEQDAITIAKQGEAAAAKTKWEQEAIKAKEVTLAQQKLEVATLAAKEAEQFKREQILRGEGEAERKRLVMQADGALDPKLQALIQMNKDQWEAIAKYEGNWVPTVINGGNGDSKGYNGAQAMIDALGIKAMKDLSVDLSLPGKNSTKK